MRHAILPSMCAVAVAASCSPALAQQAAPAAAVSPAYLNTERGLRVKTLEGKEISPSLMKGMRPEEQITKRCCFSMKAELPLPAWNGLRPSPLK